MQRQVVALVVSSLSLLMATYSAPMLYVQRSIDATTSLTVAMGPGTKALDLGPGDQRLPKPDNWYEVGYDDSAWDHAVLVASNVLDCMRQYVPGWGSAPTYWGSNPFGYYLFRQTFILPQAKSYEGSTLVVGGPTGAGYSSDPFAFYIVYLNGVQIDTWQDRGLRQDIIGTNLQAGTNVLAIYAPPTNDLTAPNVHCSALTFTIHIHANGAVQSSPPAPMPPAPTITLPGQNAVLTGPVLPFTWNAYPHAAYYDLQVWLVHAARGQKLTARSITNFAIRLRGTSYGLSVKMLPKGVYQWRMAATDAQGALISPWTSEGSVTIAQI